MLPLAHMMGKATLSLEERVYMGDQAQVRSSIQPFQSEEATEAALALESPDGASKQAKAEQGAAWIESGSGIRSGQNDPPESARSGSITRAWSLPSASGTHQQVQGAQEAGERSNATPSKRPASASHAGSPVPLPPTPSRPSSASRAGSAALKAIRSFLRRTSSAGSNKVLPLGVGGGSAFNSTAGDGL